MPLTRRAFAALSACACLVPAGAVAQTSPSGKWVCPPCGCDMHDREFDEPGYCPAEGCGMALMPKPVDPPAPPAG